MASVDTARLPEMLAEARAVRQRFSSCRAAIAGNEHRADAVASAVARHLAATVAADLPPAAQLIWQARIARPLKSDPAKPLPERAIASLRSWPSARIGDLVAALAEIEGLLIEAENEVHHEIIYAEISRAYS